MRVVDPVMMSGSAKGAGRVVWITGLGILLVRLFSKADEDASRDE